MRYALWNVIVVAPRLLSPAWRSPATEEQERIGWEIAVRIERIIAPVHDEATSGGSRRSWRPSATPRPDGVYTRSVYPSRTSAPLARSPESPRLCPPGSSPDGSVRSHPVRGKGFRYSGDQAVAIGCKHSPKCCWPLTFRRSAPGGYCGFC